jgi:N6-adenosine-specific RNA methylase IME4
MHPSMTDRLEQTMASFECGTNGMVFGSVLADPPWRFVSRTGKMAPEHKRLSRYATLTTDEICRIPTVKATTSPAHLYLWVPNAPLPDGLRVMHSWGFEYKSNIVWHRIRKDGGSDGRGVGCCFRNVTALLLFGVRGKNARTLTAGRSQVNMIGTRKREHSRKPGEQYRLIEACSPGPHLGLFARGTRPGWTYWGNPATDDYAPTSKTYGYNSASAPQRAGAAAVARRPARVRVRGRMTAPASDRSRSRPLTPARPYHHPA